jgi:hypothetical protein
MSKLVQNKQSDSSLRTNDRCICKADNITIFPIYRSNDSLSYHVSRFNYCREEWTEYWISYKYIFSALISWHQCHGYLIKI